MTNYATNLGFCPFLPAARFRYLPVATPLRKARNVENVEFTKNVVFLLDMVGKFS